MQNSVDAAFCSSKENECYVFVKNKYVVVNYAPGGKKNQIIKGPDNITDGFPMFVNTVFQWKIDSSFDTEDNLAYLFSGDQCVKIDYSPNSPENARLLEGPGPIIAMFPCLKGTIFENGIDAAARHNTDHCASLFKGDECCVINFRSNKLFLSTQKITIYFPLFLGTVFEGGIDAAFNFNPVNRDVYFFKGRYYAHINLGNGFPTRLFINGYIKLIRDEWPALRSIL
ncbi:putative Hemopexin-like domain-containing protein [Medicago truncatula]|uniref:Albumin-2 protein n=1 Tax=Medicago truncatula TaxID=3880 RepID=A0A072U8Y9_MEDTR|nr:albumin-2 [Medicago truncatula]KEH26259.1 albumin-2 protein [Medicago truncatula]RHN51468.1 putative Hemopexin-like domain-containing protein [Medicago truncatula]